MRQQESGFFTAEIDVSQGLLGLKLGEDGVTVALVDEGGLVDQWNAVHSSKGRSITPGVEIRAINGSWNPLQMSEELIKAKTLKLDLWNPRSTPSSKRAERAALLEAEAADRNALGAEPIMLLQQRINLEGKKREEAIEQLTNFMTDAIKTVSNRMEELALTQMKSQQQQGYVMQHVHAINETISDTRESERAQILQLKRLEEIQSAAAEQISHVKAEQQQLENKLNKLSSETKMCIGQLNDTLRGIVEDVAHVASLEPKMSAPALPPESDSDAGPTPSDQTIVLPRVETGETQSNSINSHVHSHGPSHVPSHVPSHAPSQVSQVPSHVPSHVPQVTSVTSGIHDPKRCQPKDAVPNFTHSTRQSSPAPLRPLQNLSFNYKSEKPPIISANVFPRNDLGTERAGDVPQMVSPRMPVSQPVNWTMSTPRLTQTTSPMVSPRFVPSPQRSPRVAQNAQSGPQLTQLSIQPQILKAWQMRPLQRADVSNLPNLSNLKPGGQTGQTGQTSQAVISPREALQDSSNSKLMTPRLEKSLPATERSRRVTSPTRNDAAGRCG